MTEYAEPRSLKLSAEAVAGYAYAAGFRGDALVTIVAIAKAESGFDAHAVGDVNLTQEGEQSTGLVQVNYRPRRDGSPNKGPRGPNYNFDAANNMQAAWSISAGGTKFTPWSTYPNLYRKHVDEARTAAKAIEARGGSPATPSTSSTASSSSRGAGGRLPVADLLDPTFSPGGGAGGFATAGFSIRGKRLSGSFDEFLTEGAVDLTLDEVPEVTLTFDDPGLVGLWASGILVTDAPVDFRDLRLTIAALEIAPGSAAEQLTVTARAEGANKLRNLTTPVVLNNQSPTDLVEVLLLNVDARSPFLGEPTAERDTVGVEPASETSEGKPKPAETHYETVDRLAKEAGFTWGHTGSQWVFGRPSWLLERGLPFRVVYSPGSGAEDPLAPELIPTVRRTTSDRKVETELTVALPRQRGEQVRPGMRLIFDGIPGFAGDYLVTEVKWPIDNLEAPVEVSAIVPKDPTPSVEGVVTPTGTPARNSRSALDFVSFAQRQAGDRYVFGAEASPTNEDPDAFDCSELVQWAAAMVGVTIADGSKAQKDACAKAGTLLPVEAAYKVRGALLFRMSGDPTHVAISLGDGKSTIEARGRAYGVTNAPITGRGWTHAGRVPGMTYTS